MQSRPKTQPMRALSEAKGRQIASVLAGSEAVFSQLWIYVKQVQMLVKATTNICFMWSCGQGPMWTIQAVSSVVADTLVTVAKLGVILSMISRSDAEQSIVATHPRAAASWRGRALCPESERKRRCTSWQGPPSQAVLSLAKHLFLWRWSSLEESTTHTVSLYCLYTHFHICSSLGREEVDAVFTSM